MPNSLSKTGLTTASLAELITQYTAALEAIYGPDINLASDTPDGQLINIFIQSVLDLEDLIVQVYNTFDPDNAIGVVLDQRVAINGIIRQGGTFTTTDVTLVINNTVNLYGLDQAQNPIYTVADSAGNQWQLVNSQLNVVPGTYQYTFQAAAPGQVLTTPNTITVPITIVLGVTSINNPTTYLQLGQDEESDAALKIRRRKSVSLRSQGYLQGLLGALNNINGVTAYVLENDTSGTDSNGIPGHSIWVIIGGSAAVPLSTAYSTVTTYSYGQIASSGSTNYISVANNNLNQAVTNPAFWAVYNPIAEAIYNYRNAGCGMKYNPADAGANAYSITQIDGSSFAVYWYSVISEDLFIRAKLTSLNGVNPPAIASISNFLAGTSTSAAAFIPGVDQEVNINQLSTLIQQADPNTLVTYPSGYGFSSGQSQTLTLSGIAASGTFKVSYNGQLSSTLHWNDTISTIQTAVQALSGLSAVTVTGSIASQSLVFNLSSLSSVLSLITVSANSLMTSAPAAITFTPSAVYSFTLSPTQRNNQFSISKANLIFLPMILSCLNGQQVLTVQSDGSYQVTDTTVSVLHGGHTIAFSALGGYGASTYALISGAGSINATSGVYTSSTVGVDLVNVTDSLGNVATATITVT